MSFWFRLLLIMSDGVGHEVFSILFVAPVNYLWPSPAVLVPNSKIANKGGTQPSISRARCININNSCASIVLLLYDQYSS